jgi:D-alanyl-lipoteichoic acid acyltransferase DltB (MBOAT superfamily)
MQRSGGGRRRTYLIISLVVNLGLLGVFKYYGFFSRELAILLQSLGIDASIPVLDVILPVGISFYTFQTLSYTIDVYRGRTKATRHFFDFALYVAFFPQLVAGPIERSSHLLPQMFSPRRVTGDDFRLGLYLVGLGLFTKVVVADNMARIVNTVFASSASELSGAECLLAIYAFAFQIYGDFYGYSMIAKGVARWLGFDIMTNFARPYFARSPREFWRRWHISLSTWLRDYLYIPLGGNKDGRARTYRNLMLTMLLGGLWHGANWTFVIWGLFHGLLLAVHRLMSGPLAKRVTAPGPGGWLACVVNFHLVCLGWLFFRASSFDQIRDMLRLIIFDFRWTDFATSAVAMIIFIAGPFMAYEAWIEKRKDENAILQVHWMWLALLLSYFAIMGLFFPPLEAHEFIYFQF